MPLATTIAPPLRYFDIPLNLSSLTWLTSGAGKYYWGDTTENLGIVGTPIAITIKGWDAIRASDNIQPYISSDTRIGLMSNVNTFQTSVSGLTLRVVCL